MPKPKTIKEARSTRMEDWRKEYVSDWIGDIALKDGGKVFMKSVSDLANAPVTYGDLRQLMRQDAEINERD